MEEEKFFSGYCRAIDASRTVTAEQWQGKWEADCAYPDCPHAPVCQIAEEIRKLDSYYYLYRKRPQDTMILRSFFSRSPTLPCRQADEEQTFYEAAFSHRQAIHPCVSIPGLSEHAD